MKKKMSYVLKQDVVIPKGTILRPSPVTTTRLGEYVSCVMAVGESKDTHGIFEYAMDDIEESIKAKYFEELEEWK